MTILGSVLPVTLSLLLAVGYSLDPDTATVMGRVTLRDGRTPERARISLIERGFYYTVRADKHGHFIFFSVPPGSYRVDAAADGAINCYHPLAIIDAGQLYDFNVTVDNECM